MSKIELKKAAYTEDQGLPMLDVATVRHGHWVTTDTPHEEPAQSDKEKAIKKRLYDILRRSCTCRDIGEVASMLYDNGVTFREV